MSDSLNNKELVAVGHQFAKTLSSDTPFIDMAKIVSRLAERLDCTTAALREMTKQRDALVAENATLKSAIQTHSESVHFCELCGKDDPCSTDDVCMVLNKTPATDAFLAEVQASAIEYAASERWGSGYVFDELNEFAAQLRQGAAR
ncbi:hypothetical protein VC596_08975 [Citrobacter freundii]|uniref:hypothetical protein n=1 Tax=Citrobacter freundii TaxID=546 RepID=UPI000B5AA76E|nr:hypothetical protein [Citrobacter freundii]ASJ99428.1 hypothetical protein CFA70_03900 [Citrobacter freundii]MDV1214334.1 hypothetical protein [Citrobacter freundii]MDV1774356.1 hypothetical protein [Citrobacter freundii]MEB0390945.1 hypothetical protein [Citrobacter freundii]MEB0452767.1 hypothetical protein [Citrobacter freundii]